MPSGLSSVADDQQRDQDVDFHRIVDSIPGMVAVTRPDGVPEHANPEFLAYFGITLEQLQRWATEGLIHPDHFAHEIESWTEALTTGNSHEVESRYRRADGAFRWCHTRAFPLRDSERRIVRWFVLTADVDDRRRADLLLAGENRLLQMVAGGESLLATLEELCRLVEAIASGSRCAVFLADSAGTRIEAGIGPNIPTALLDRVVGRPIAVDSAPAAMACCVNEQVIAADLAAETRWAPDWTTMARAHDIRACWATPFSSRAGRVLGACALYCDEPRAPADSEQNVIRQFMQIAGIVVERAQSDAERSWAEMQLAGEKRLLEMIASGRPLDDVLGALCRFVEEAAADCLCGVYPIDWSGPIFHNAVAPSLPLSYTRPIEGLAVRCDVAPCGIAALHKTQVIVVDMQSDSHWQATPYRDHVLCHGLRSVWSTPILSLDGRVLGTFALYGRKPATPSTRQQELIALVTHIASIALERAQAEAALQRSRAFLAEGERLSLTGTFSWRVKTGRFAWSEQVYRMFDVDPSVPPTLDLIRSRIHPEDMTLFQEMIGSARTDERDFEFEHRLQMPGGGVKYLRVVAHATRDHDGRLEYIGAVQDVTSLRRSEEDLGRVRSELAHVARVSSLGALTASIAHEVNQPLSGIVTNASTCLRMLDSDPPNLEGARETARRMIRDGHRASDVVTRLRALFSNRSRAVEAVDLNEATREVIALLRSELQRKRVSLRRELADDLPMVAGDRVQFQQVILNLLLNASDAMSGVDDRPRQAVVSTGRDEGDRVRVTVRDSGEGLSDQAIERIFEPFYTTKDDGMGIGLAVSRSIIESHHGRIWASPNDGPGATFAFSIPCGSNGERPLRSE